MKDDDRLVEVHCFYSERCLVTVHRDDAPAFDEVRERYEKRKGPIERPSLLLYRLIDALVDSFFPILADFDDRIDTLEDAIFRRADDTQLQDLFAMKRLLVGLRKAVSPQRDTFARLAGGIGDLPGFTDEDERYFRDVYDHLIRISDLIDSYRDLLTGAMDVYLSTVSNRLNDVMKKLTVIATIFLPLAWITGFFGQNFGWLVRNVGSWEAFLFLGIGDRAGRDRGHGRSLPPQRLDLAARYSSRCVTCGAEEDADARRVAREVVVGELCLGLVVDDEPVAGARSGCRPRRSERVRTTLFRLTMHIEWSSQ